MTHINKFDDIAGMTLYDSGGEKIGTIKDLFLDQRDEEPEWATVSSGILGTKRHFVPLEGISPHEDGVTTAFSKEQILSAPRVNAEEELSEADEARLYSHYSRGEDKGQQAGQERHQQPGRMRLRKYVVTETQQVEIPTKREVYKLEDEQASSEDNNQEIADAGRNSARKPAFGEVRKPLAEEEHSE